MKRSVLVFLMSALLFIGGMRIAKGQEQPAPKKDTVNMDTDAKPTFYYAVEDDKATDKSKGSGSKMTLIVAGIFGLILVGGAVYYFTKKKK